MRSAVFVNIQFVDHVHNIPFGQFYLVTAIPFVSAFCLFDIFCHDFQDYFYLLNYYKTLKYSLQMATVQSEKGCCSIGKSVISVIHFHHFIVFISTLKFDS